MVTAPPVAPAVAVAAPADSVRAPPAPVSPEPTVNAMAPPAPPVAVPVAMLTEPLAPAVETPLLTEMEPLTPLVPASALRMVITPELVLPEPLMMLNCPPVDVGEGSFVFPAERYNWPPEPVAEDPTVT